MGSDRLGSGLDGALAIVPGFLAERAPRLVVVGAVALPIFEPGGPPEDLAVVGVRLHRVCGKRLELLQALRILTLRVERVETDGRLRSIRRGEEGASKAPPTSTMRMRR